MPAVQPPAASEVPSHPFPQAGWFILSSIALLTADHGPRAEVTKLHLGHSLRHFQVPEGTSSSHKPRSRRGTGAEGRLPLPAARAVCGCAAPGGAGTPEGRCAGRGAAVRFHPPVLPGASLPGLSPVHAPLPCPWHTPGQEETRPRTAGSRQAPPK